MQLVHFLLEAFLACDDVCPVCRMILYTQVDEFFLYFVDDVLAVSFKLLLELLVVEL